MNIAIIAVTKNGVALSKRISFALSEENCKNYALEKFADEECTAFSSLKELTAQIFQRNDALIFICACGIAVRMIAPHIVSKQSDPAVVVIDEQGKFAVSLLSGHIGGANALAERAARIVGAVPVITTATDIGRRFSPDSFAVANRLYIVEPDAAKAVASAVVDGKRIGLRCDYPFDNAPIEIDTQGNHDAGICISDSVKNSPFAITLHLIPRNIIIGAGCKKDISPDVFERFILDRLDENGIPICRVCTLHTIDVKRNEPAMNQFCRKYGIEMRTFTAGQLMNAKGSFEGSQFVLKTVGADNVCERSAALGGRIIIHKQSGCGVTFAAAEKEVTIDFGRTQK